MSNVSFRIKQDNVVLSQQKVTVTNSAVATIKFVFGMCACMIYSDVGMGDFFARAGGFACVWTHARATARVSEYRLLVSLI